MHHNSLDNLHIFIFQALNYIEMLASSIGLFSWTHSCSCSRISSTSIKAGLVQYQMCNKNPPVFSYQYFYLNLCFFILKLIQISKFELLQCSHLKSCLQNFVALPIAGKCLKNVRVFEIYIPHSVIKIQFDNIFNF